MRSALPMRTFILPHTPMRNENCTYPYSMYNNNNNNNFFNFVYKYSAIHKTFHSIYLSKQRIAKYDSKTIEKT